MEQTTCDNQNAETPQQQPKKQRMIINNSLLSYQDSINQNVLQIANLGCYYYYFFFFFFENALLIKQIATQTKSYDPAYKQANPRPKG